MIDLITSDCIWSLYNIKYQIMILYYLYFIQFSPIVQLNIKLLTFSYFFPYILYIMQNLLLPHNTPFCVNIEGYVSYMLQIWFVVLSQTNTCTLENVNICYFQTKPFLLLHPTCVFALRPELLRSTDMKEDETCPSDLRGKLSNNHQLLAYV